MGAGWTYGGDEEEEGNVALSTGHGRQRKWLDGRIDEWMVWWMVDVCRCGGAVRVSPGACDNVDH